MKKMTCLQLGGACDQVFEAETFEEIAELSKKHAMEMFQKGELSHIEKMNEMKALMNKPGAVQEWMAAKKAEFNAL